MKSVKRNSLLCTALSISVLASSYATDAVAQYNGAIGGPIAHTAIGADNNSVDNPFVQPQDDALAGGGRDQTLQFGDVLVGTLAHDLLIGRLGTDVMAGNSGNDVMIGGTEHFNPSNRDRAFGGWGQDVFLWAPGDGSDLFSGGHHQDAVVFGLIGEIENGETVFRVSNDQQAGEISLDPATQLPQIDVTNSPGFCEVIDRNSTADASDQLEALSLDHLVRFSIRAVRDAFENGDQTDDNGLRVTLHLSDVEVLVCTSREGGSIEVLDLTVSPPAPITSDALHPALQARLEAMVL